MQSFALTESVDATPVFDPPSEKSAYLYKGALLQSRAKEHVKYAGNQNSRILHSFGKQAAQAN
jgi:hypothetical protein